MATAADYFELTLRAGEDFEVIITVNESGAPKDLSGWTILESELALDEAGTTLVTATVAFNTDGINGELKYSIAKVDTELLQTGGNKQGVVDIFGLDDSNPTRTRRIGKGRWILDESVTNP